MLQSKAVDPLHESGIHLIWHTIDDAQYIDGSYPGIHMHLPLLHLPLPLQNSGHG